MYTDQIVDIILKTVRRQMAYRFKESLSKLDETCSHCKHDRKQVKKIAVSVIEDVDESPLDQMWLRKFFTVMNITRILSDSGLSSLQRLSRIARVGPAFAAPTGEVNLGVFRQLRDLILGGEGNLVVFRQSGEPILRVRGKLEGLSAARSTETPVAQRHGGSAHFRQHRPQEHPGDPRDAPEQRQGERDPTSF
eukprot:s345_g40.t1